ncbi:MAG TPA: DUF1638 domain-containing protein [Anaerolineaceae bacterium]|jgi:hypothetical protein
MRYKCLTCEALTRPVYLSAALSPHSIDIELVRIGLHDRPKDLRSQLQAMIDAVPAEKYDAVLLAYGLCGQATAGLAARQAPLVMPRAHDCITLFLGSRERYRQQFEGNPGTYWYSQDYMERRDSASLTLSMGSGVTDNIQAEYDRYVEKYGKDNADYLMEVMGGWSSHYNRAVFIDLEVGDASSVEALARAEAQRRGWTFEHLPGDIGLIRRLVMGEWDDDFLVVPPGQKIVMTGTDGVVGFEST